MTLPAEKRAAIRKMLVATRTIAVVGLSPKPHRPSHRVARYLAAAGYTVIPVNPGQDFVLDLPCYPNLRAVPGRIDMVDIFRRSELVMEVIEDAIAVKAKYIWMQEGIANKAAAARAAEAGLNVVMDRCIMIDHMNLL